MPGGLVYSAAENLQTWHPILPPKPLLGRYDESYDGLDEDTSDATGVHYGGLIQSSPSLETHSSKSHSANRSSKESRLAKKAIDGEVGASALSLKLSKMNYRVWSMTIEVYLDSHNLWQVIIGENASKKKVRQALAAIISCVPEDLLGILDAKKSAKEN